MIDNKVVGEGSLEDDFGLKLKQNGNTTIKLIYFKGINQIKKVFIIYIVKIRYYK